MMQMTTARDDNEVFAEWMHKHQGIVFKVARSFTDSRAEQEDLAQEIRVAVWQSVRRFDRRSKPSSYIYRIALNRAISWRRSLRAHEEKLAHYEAGRESAADPSGDDPRVELLYAEIRRMDELNRSLILMQLDGFNYQEIAETLGLTATNVGVRLNRIRRTLTENLKGANV